MAGGEYRNRIVDLEGWRTIPSLLYKKITMKNSALILFAIWILFAILDIVALFVNMPLAFSIIFAILNGTVVLGSIPIFIQEFKDRKYRKYLDA